MEIITKKEAEKLSLYKRRMELLVGARVRDKSDISSAVKIQDKLRKKIGSWQGSEEIKKWRLRT